MSDDKQTGNGSKLELDYLDLWKYFSEDTAKIKDKLWTIASSLYALMSGIMGFIVKYLIDQTTADKCLVVLMVLTGLLLSIYTAFMIGEYGRHIRSGWRMTDFLTQKIDGLQEVWDKRKSNDPKGIFKWLYGTDDGKGLPPFVIRLQWLAMGYGFGFIGILIYAYSST